MIIINNRTSQEEVEAIKTMSQEEEEASSKESVSQTTHRSTDDEENNMINPRMVMTGNDEEERNDEEEESHLRYSLNSKNNKYVGVLQSLSLILNAGLMVYAHVGLSGVFLSNHSLLDADFSSVELADSTAYGEGKCVADANDLDVWVTGRGAHNKSAHLTQCALGENCLTSPDCTTQCFHEHFGYSLECASCFAPLPACNFLAGCESACTGDKLKTVEGHRACYDCSAECDAAFYNCSGFPDVDIFTEREEAASVGSNASNPDAASVESNATSSRGTTSQLGLQQLEDVCETQGIANYTEVVEEYHVVYDLVFGDSIKAAWNGDARLLAVIIVIFSGIWPYAKNVILMLAWYVPMTEGRRSKVLLWLRRLGKYTLVDVYAVIALLVGVSLNVVVTGDVPVLIKGEPRFAIVAFLTATLWEFVHMEWMTSCHQHNLQPHAGSTEEGERTGRILDALRFQTTKALSSKKVQVLACHQGSICLRVVVWMKTLYTIALFVVGSTLDVIRFQSITFEEGQDDSVCEQSYNLYSFATKMISDFNLHLSSTGAQTMIWVLFVSYITLLVALPLFVHLVQVLVFVANVKNKTLCLAADALWTFCSVDVFLLALFVVQYKFKELLEAIGGDLGSQFFGIEANLGPGFFVLIGYCVLAGITQWIFNCAVAEYFQHDAALNRRVRVPGHVACCYSAEVERVDDKEEIVEETEEARSKHYDC